MFSVFSDSFRELKNKRPGTPGIVFVFNCLVDFACIFFDFFIVPKAFSGDSGGREPPGCFLNSTVKIYKCLSCNINLNSCFDQKLPIRHRMFKEASCFNIFSLGIFWGSR